MDNILGHRRFASVIVFLMALPTLAIETEGVRIDPPLAITLNDRGEEFRKKGEYESAIKEYTEAIRLNPQFSWPYNNRGLARAAQSDFENALKDYAEAIRLDPKYAFAFNNRGLVWAAKSEFENAMSDYNEAIRVNPKYAFPYHNRGVVWIKRNDYRKAIADFAEAIQLDPLFAAPTCPDPSFRAGKEAIVFATKACELTGWKSYAELDTLAAAYAEAGEFTSAVIWGLTALEKAPDSERSAASERLDLYRAGKPYHQIPKPEVKRP